MLLDYRGVLAFFLLPGNSCFVSVLKELVLCTYWTICELFLGVSALVFNPALNLCTVR